MNLLRELDAAQLRIEGVEYTVGYFVAAFLSFFLFFLIDAVDLMSYY